MAEAFWVGWGVVFVDVAEVVEQRRWEERQCRGDVEEEEWWVGWGGGGSCGDEVRRFGWVSEERNCGGLVKWEMTIVVM